LPKEKRRVVMAKSFVKSIVATEVDASTLGVGLVPINVNGLDQACFLIRIINNSNVTILISYDGINAGDVLPPNNILQLDFQTNSAPNGFVANLKKGTVVSVDSTAPGIGLIFLCGYYQEN